MYKVSVIIPVYNSEKYINQCIDSVLDQTYNNIELILINDGSTDNSLEILKKYKSKFSQIKIINQNNSGVSYSRNIGLKTATGDYIMFIDSDDIIIKNYIEQMMEYLQKNNLDIIKSSYKKFKKDISNCINVSFFKENYKIINKNEINKLFIETTNFNSSCMQIINKKIIDNNKIEFENNIGFAEDFLFTYKVFEVANKIGYINNNGYVCRENIKSISRTGQINKQIKNCLDTIKSYKILYNDKNYEDVSNKILLHITYLIRSISVKNISYNTFKNELCKFFDNILWKELKKNKLKIKNRKKINKILSKLIYKEKIFLIYFYIKIFQLYFKINER